ncbi:hypothetical protein TNIN_124191, partial [Trichonephila inaurata madagascariensis]
ATLNTPPQQNFNGPPDGFTPLSLFRKRVECVSEFPPHPAVRRLCRLKHQSASSSVGKRKSDEGEGGKRSFLWVVPREIGGPKEGAEGRAVARKPVQHFLMSVGRLKTLFWGKREAQN